MDTAILGLRLGIEGMQDFIETFRSAEIAQSVISYGYPIFQNSVSGDAVSGYTAHSDTITLTMSGAFTSGDITSTPTVSGTALTGVTWASYGSDTLMGNKIAAEVQAALIALGSTLATCTYSTSTHAFTAFAPGLDFTFSLVCSNNTTSTTVYSSQCLFMGVTTFDQVSYKSSTGGYPYDVAGNYAYMGQIWVYAAVAVQAGQSAYVIIQSGATQNQFTNVAGSTPNANYPTKGIFRSSTTGAGLVLLELRGKQNYAGTL